MTEFYKHSAPTEPRRCSVELTERLTQADLTADEAGKMAESDKSCKHNLQKRRFLFRFVPLVLFRAERNKHRGFVGGRAASEVGFVARSHGINAVAIQRESALNVTP